MKKFVFVLAILAMATGAHAAKLTLNMEVQDAWNEAFTAKIPVPDILVPQPTPVWLDVKMTFEVAELGAGERGFGNAAFDVVSDAVVLTYLTSHYGFTAVNDDVALNPPPPGQTAPSFDVIGDKGTDTTDLAGVVVSIAAGLADESGTPALPEPRIHFGEAAPKEFGQLFVKWDGVSAGTLDFTNMDMSITEPGTGLLVVAVDPTLVGNGLTFLPEPASLTLLALGGLALIRRRK